MSQNNNEVDTPAGQSTDCKEEAVGKKTYVAPKKSKAPVILIALAVLAVVFLRFYTQAPQDTNIVVALDYTPNTNHTGMYVAKELGYYDEAGLKVDIVQPAEDGADAMVATGSAQFGVAYQDVMANYLGSEKPLPVSAVAAILQHNTSGIMSSKAAGIHRPSEMANHTYATWNIPVEQAIVKAVVEGDGGDFSKVKMVPYNTTDEIQSLKSGDFEAVWVFEGWAGQNAKLQGYEHNYFAFGDINPVFDYYTPVIVSSNDYLSKHPDEAQKFIDATKRGYEFAASHPEEAAKILLKAVPELDEDMVLASQKYLSNVYVDEQGEWGKIDPVRWNAFYTWMNDNKLTETTLTTDAGLNTAFVK